MSKPLLTIGIIFRNDIRSLAMCLEALRPLREAIPCELIMVDTGSTDGSRAVAEEYANLVFDFPWVDDFAAARNAVMDRARGEWYFTVDSDEYLDPDISELVCALQLPKPEICAYRVIQRNYETLEMDGAFSDFGAQRILRMSTGLRYEGVIHECWAGLPQGTAVLLSNAVLHHDGYAKTGRGEAEKMARNLKLLKKRLEHEPDELVTLLQYIESGREEPDIIEVLRHALAVLAQKPENWDWYGSPLLRHAVYVAQTRNLPELAEWAQWAEDWFPDSFYTRIDVNYILMVHNWHNGDYNECIRRSEACMQAYVDYRKTKDQFVADMSSTLAMESPYWEENMRLNLANAYLKVRQPNQTIRLLKALDHKHLDGKLTKNLVLVLRELQLTGIDGTVLARRAWDSISLAIPNRTRANERTAAFLRTGAEAFQADVREDERTREDFHAPSYTVFRKLSCELGVAAAILDGELPEIEKRLSKVKNWDHLPIQALTHALKSGAAFPPPGRTLQVEEMDSLAGRMAYEDAAGFALEGAVPESLQELCWKRALTLSAVQSCRWEDAEQGMALACRFVEVEKKVLPLLYTAGALREENLFLLPPLHRFGWYCTQAFDFLDAGDQVGYVRALRQGLNACGNMGPMVEFLTEHTPQLQAPPPPPELLAMAEQIRILLSGFSADDPAVLALKQSEAYQKVAYLVEGSGM